MEQNRFNPDELFLERIDNLTECKNLLFKKPISNIGRGEIADVSIKSEGAKTVSRLHSQIEFRNGKMYIINLSKTNFTYLNNDKVIQPTQVEEGDFVGFGSRPNSNIIPALPPNQCFIYKCRKPDRIVILSDEDDQSSTEEDESSIEEDQQSNDEDHHSNDAESDVQKNLSKDEIDKLCEEVRKDPGICLVNRLKIDACNNNNISTIEIESSDDEDVKAKDVVKTVTTELITNKLKVEIVINNIDDDEIDDEDEIDDGDEIDDDIFSRQSSNESSGMTTEINNIVDKLHIDQIQSANRIKIPIIIIPKLTKKDIEDGVKNYQEFIIEDRKTRSDQVLMKESKVVKDIKRKSIEDISEQYFSSNIEKFSRTELEKRYKAVQNINKIKSITDPDSENSDQDFKSHSSRFNNNKDKPSTSKRSNILRPPSKSKELIATSSFEVQTKTVKRKLSPIPQSSNSYSPNKFPKSNFTRNNSSNIMEHTNLRDNSNDKNCAAPKIKFPTSSPVQQFPNDSNKQLKSRFDRRKSICTSEMKRQISIIDALPLTKPGAHKTSLNQRRSSGGSAKIKEIDMFSKATSLKEKKFDIKKKNFNTLKHRRQTFSGERINENNDAVKEARKQKLYEIALKNGSKKKQEEETKVEPKPSQKAKSALKVKITSENRGHHLIATIPPIKPISSKKIDEPPATSATPTTPNESLTRDFRQKYCREISEVNKTNNNDILCNNDNDANIRNENETSNQIFKHHELESNSESKIEEDSPEIELNLNLELPILEQEQDSPMKNDPRGKTKFVRQTAQDLIELAKFPDTEYLGTEGKLLIVEENDSAQNLISCMKNCFARKNVKKRVSFKNEDDLVTIHEIEPRKPRPLKLLSPSCNSTSNQFSTTTTTNNIHLPVQNAYSTIPSTSGRFDYFANFANINPISVPSQFTFNKFNQQIIPHRMTYSSQYRPLQLNHINLPRSPVISNVPSCSSQSVQHSSFLTSSTNSICTLSKSLKELESTACDEILQWDSNWLNCRESVPWQIIPMKSSYISIDEYKAILKVLMHVELLKKLCCSFQRMIKGSPTIEQWKFMMVKTRTEINNRIRLELQSSDEGKVCKPGMLLMLKIRRTTDMKDIYFLGYVSAINENGIWIVETLSKHKDISRELAVTKIILLSYIRPDLKSLAALSNLHETPIVKQILHSELNEINHDTLKKMPDSVNIPISLDMDQTDVWRMILNDINSPNVLCISGGAGTGKTHVMIAIILHLICKAKLEFRYIQPSFLICSVSDTCIDEIATFLYKLIPCVPNGIKMVRVGNRDQMRGVGLKYSLYDQVQNSLNNGHTGKKFEDVSKILVENADIVLTTVSSSYELYNFRKKFDICFIEEANECIDANLIVPIQLNINKLILIGDDQQIVPIAQSSALLNSKFDKTLFARMIETFKEKSEKVSPVFTLTSQHRMHSEILKFCNENIYGNVMRIQTLSTSPKGSFTLAPYHIFGVNTATRNEIQAMSSFCKNVTGIFPNDVGVAILTATLQLKEEIKKKVKDRIKVSIIESSQGIERDIILVVITHNDIKHFGKYNRLKVALTRARKALYICAGLNVCCHPDPGSLLENLIIDAKARNVYHDIQNPDDVLENILKLSKENIQNFS